MHNKDFWLFSNEYLLPKPFNEWSVEEFEALFYIVLFVDRVEA